MFRSHLREMGSVEGIAYCVGNPQILLANRDMYHMVPTFVNISLKPYNNRVELRNN